MYICNLPQVENNYTLPDNLNLIYKYYTPFNQSKEYRINTALFSYQQLAIKYQRIYLQIYLQEL